MVCEFLLPFGRLNFLSLSEEKKKEVLKQTELKITKATKLFEYKKANKDYWNRPKLHKQVVNKALPIAEVLYPGYLLLFLFDNATSHTVYTDNLLHTIKINKSSGGK